MLWLMCNLSAIILKTEKCTTELVKHATESVRKMDHRGPDSFAIKIIQQNETSIVLMHNRLQIVGNSKKQPISNSDDTVNLIINGEIFNWKTLEVELDYKCTQSDCEIIIPLYLKYIRFDLDFTTFFSKLNGQFSFVLHDTVNQFLFVARDHIGITPLYTGYRDELVMFSSELKLLTSEMCTNIEIFQPRRYSIYSVDTGLNILTNSYINYNDLYINNNNNEDYTLEIQKSLTNAVSNQLHDLSVDWGVLLSGGLDSSLITSLVSKQLNTPIKTFSIGISSDSVDLIAARKVSEFLKTDHHEYYFTIEEGISAIRDVIYYIESYDTTTVRASTAMYLLTKKIKKDYPDLKVLFSGELADELFGSYLYCANAPNENEFLQENLKLVNNVHKFDCLRSNKSCMANSIECRVPFTDPDFIKTVLKIPAQYKTYGKLNNDKIEKQLLREAFSDNYLPTEILWRTKNAFSDAVSTENDLNWIDSIIEYCNHMYTDTYFKENSPKFTYLPPKTKEELYYREIFKNHFNKDDQNNSEQTVEYWKPNWCGSGHVDPSAKINKTYFS